jgi:type I restriction enzyme R subunit
MPAPGEHKTVQARILKHAQEVGWTHVLRAETEDRRGFDLAGATPEERAQGVAVPR